jgi:RNA polymerase sigma factor (sigma-70 family)
MAAKKKTAMRGKTAGSGEGAAGEAGVSEVVAAGGEVGQPAGEEEGGKVGDGGEERIQKAKARYPETRKSLIEKLDNWEDQRAWDQFYRTYATFIFNVACKAGLTEAEASDAVQETFIGVAKHLQKKKFIVGIGSFKSFLMNQARWRIMDQMRNRKKNTASGRSPSPFDDDRRTATIDRHADPAGEELEKIWDREWQHNLLDIALRRLRAKVSPQQYQIFSAYVVKGWPPERVREELGVSTAQVYLAKHRVGRLLRKEIEALESGELM